MNNPPANIQWGVRWPVPRTSVALTALIAAGTFAIGACAPSAESESPETDRTYEDAADSLVSMWIDSVGGMDRYHEFQSATYTVETILYDTLSGRVKRSRPRYVWIKKGPNGEETRVERWEPSGFIEQGFDGVTAWALHDGAVLPDTAKDAREALYVSRDLFYWIGLPYKLRDPGVILTYRGMVSRPGMEFRADPTQPAVSPPDNGYHAVGVSFEAGVGEHQDVFMYYFEPGEVFPTEVTYVEEGRTNINRMLWTESSWAGEFNYPYPARRDFITESGKRTKVLTIYDVTLNSDIPQSVFEGPTSE